MSARVSPTDRIHSKIDDLFAQDRPLPQVLEEVARLGAQLLMQTALEAEVPEFLGRDRYQRAATVPDARPGSRNGYRPVRVKTTAGPIRLERPKLRGITAAFASRLFGKHVTRTNALESLVIASFVRGLSVRHVDATLAEALGDQAAISKSTASAICQRIKDQFDAWTRRRLDGIVLDYPFLDASYFRMHPGSPAEPVLAAWGITTDGNPSSSAWRPRLGSPTDARADIGVHRLPKAVWRQVWSNNPQVIWSPWRRVLDVVNELVGSPVLCAGRGYLPLSMTRILEDPDAGDPCGDARLAA